MARQMSSNQAGTGAGTWEPCDDEELDEDDEDIDDDEANSTALEMRRNQVIPSHDFCN